MQLIELQPIERLLLTAVKRLHLKLRTCSSNTLDTCADPSVYILSCRLPAGMRGRMAPAARGMVLAWRLGSSCSSRAASSSRADGPPALGGAPPASLEEAAAAAVAGRVATGVRGEHPHCIGSAQTAGCTNQYLCTVDLEVAQ